MKGEKNESRNSARKSNARPEKERGDGVQAQPKGSDGHINLTWILIRFIG